MKRENKKTLIKARTLRLGGNSSHKKGRSGVKKKHCVPSSDGICQLRARKERQFLTRELGWGRKIASLTRQRGTLCDLREKRNCGEREGGTRALTSQKRTPSFPIRKKGGGETKKLLRSGGGVGARKIERDAGGGKMSRRRSRK